MRPACLAALLFAGAAIGVTIAFAGAAADEAPRVRIQLTAPPDCPDGADFARQLRGHGAIGVRMAVAPAGAPVPLVRTDGGERLVRVEIAPHSPGVLGRLYLTDSDGSVSERHLEASDCRAAVSALALIAALALERSGPGPTASAEPAPASTPAPSPPSALPSAPGPAPPSTTLPAPVLSRSPALTPPPAPPLTPAPTHAPRAQATLRLPPGLPIAVAFSAGAEAFVAFGMTPAPAAGWRALAGVALALDGGLLQATTVRAGIEGVPARSYAIPAGQAAFSTLAAIAEVCPVSWRLFTRGHGGLCAVGELGTLNASGPNGANALSRPWVTVGLEVRAALVLAGPLFVDLSIEGVVPIARDRFVIGSDLIYATPAVAARVAAGIGLRVP